MSEEFQKHMFEQFTQEHEDDRTEYKGTGLGLAIVKRIVEKMGGEIRVNSKKDVGTEFIWTLTFATDKDFVEKCTCRKKERTVIQTAWKESSDSRRQ